MWLLVFIVVRDFSMFCCILRRGGELFPGDGYSNDGERKKHRRKREAYQRLLLVIILVREIPLPSFMQRQSSRNHLPCPCPLSHKPRNPISPIRILILIPENSLVHPMSLFPMQRN